MSVHADGAQQGASRFHSCYACCALLQHYDAGVRPACGLAPSVPWMLRTVSRTCVLHHVPLDHHGESSRCLMPVSSNAHEGHHRS